MGTEANLIAATSPTVVSATYDKWAFKLETHGFGCAHFGESAVPPIAMTVALRKFRVRDDGKPELSPLETDQVVIDIPDLYVLAAERPEVAHAVGALVAAVGGYAGENGLI